MLVSALLMSVYANRVNIIVIFPPLNDFLLDAYILKGGHACFICLERVARALFSARLLLIITSGQSVSSIERSERCYFGTVFGERPRHWHQRGGSKAIV